MLQNLTNNLDLPDAICRAVANDPYTKGESDYSATELLKPPRVRALQKTYANKITEDVSDRIWSLFGQLGHLLIERAGGNEVKEVRVFKEIDGKIISAQIDNLCLEKGVLSDFKFVTAWKFKGNAPPDADFTAQLNMQKYLLEENGYRQINTLQIIGILRDWSKADARQYDDYPQFQVVKQDIPIWEKERVEAFIRMRIAVHESAARELPDCSTSEMWQRPAVWAVHRRGAKKAVKLLTNEQDAIELAKELGSTYEVRYRPGLRVRCALYCSVAQFCEQNNRMSGDENDY